MKVLIFNNQITGIAPDDQDPLNLPRGFAIAEYDGNLPIESLYFSDGEIKEIPPCPTEGNYQWNGSEWIESAPIVISPIRPEGNYQWNGSEWIESPAFSVPTTRPDGNYQWNGSGWVEIPPIVIPPIGPNWAGLLSDLRGSEAWAKSFGAASVSIAANSAWTLLYGTVTNTKHLPDLMFSIGALRSAMASSEVGDFTDSEIDSINAIMTDRGFPEIHPNPETIEPEPIEPIEIS